MAPPRPSWKGYLKLSLVSCPIAVYPATSTSERVSFRQINKKTGNRLKQQLIDEQTGAVVETADKGRGYEVAKNTYMAIEDEELDAISIESNETIEIDSFVPRAQIDERFLDSPYYLIPDDKAGQDAFAVIREAMRGKDMVALGRVVLAKRERVMMLQPWDKGLLGTTLRYAYEVRDAATYFGDLPEVVVPADMLTLAEHILDTKAATFDPTRFRDRYEEAMVAMLQTKTSGARPASGATAAPDQRNVIDLMEALKRSLGGGGAKPADVLKVKKPRKRIEGQREMLLPITGSAPAKAVVAKAAVSKKAAQDDGARDSGAKDSGAKAEAAKKPGRGSGRKAG